jgi:excisionase family DNA binding protein
MDSLTEVTDMTTSSNATVERIDGPDSGTGEAPAMLTVHDVARMLNCSIRHVARMTDAGLLPQPVKLGQKLRRWRREMIEEWLDNGCPRVRSAKGGR